MTVNVLDFSVYLVMFRFWFVGLRFDLWNWRLFFYTRICLRLTALTYVKLEVCLWAGACLWEVTVWFVTDPEISSE